ncbi:hypothetical protein [Rubellicoccus peritrichatus]|uniref:Uncharacterized protein n=1 Tax=Rubellicoccus peritrichatus TaxID=3080537 RepID=A0AAQ3QWZ4_9BACT|nr:hypothetical protein [Puniceicoccus sp. CR14]WOO42452.1 hypothetical protein RZN69_05070 [Puniceicoccus sp. CR14]
MKLTIAILLCVSLCSLRAELVSVALDGAESSKITATAGQIIKIHNIITSELEWDSPDASNASLPRGISVRLVISSQGIVIEKDTFKATADVSLKIASEQDTSLHGMLIPGPAEIWLKGIADESQALLVAEVLENETSILEPASTFVLPSASGDVDLQLEKSSDLVNWEPALLGNYSSSSSPVFFRLRIVR